MRKVILVRHAKSSWDDPALDDHDRPLNARGRAAAPVIARWLAARGHLPDRVLCSSALRTRETARLMTPDLPGMPVPEIEPGLYHATPEAMRARLADLPETVGTVMLIGHNPGLSALARKLAGGRVRPGCARAFTDFPTAAAAVFTSDAPRWDALGFGQCTFVDFARPKELATGG